MQKGEIVEEGDHESLMNIQGLYFNLAKQQNLRQMEEEDDDELKLENKEITKLMFNDQMKDISIDKTVTPIVKSCSYEKKKSLKAYNLLENDDKNKIKTKVIKINS
jgi:hypothetical protein